MPGVHNQNAQLLGFWADRDPVERLDGLWGSAEWSQFLTEALVAYTECQTAVLENGAGQPRDRTGKGGPKDVFPGFNRESLALKEEATKSWAGRNLSRLSEDGA